MREETDYICIYIQKKTPMGDGVCIQKLNTLFLRITCPFLFLFSFTRISAYSSAHFKAVLLIKYAHFEKPKISLTFTKNIY